MPEHTKDLIAVLLEFGLSTAIIGTGLLLIVGNIGWKKRWKWDE
jgi:hypothetical protein